MHTQNIRLDKCIVENSIGKHWGLYRKNKFGLLNKAWKSSSSQKMLKDAWWQVTRWVVVLPTSLQAPELLSSWAPPPSFYIHTPGRGSNYNDSVSAPSRKTFTASNIKHQTTGGKNVSLINTFERWRRQMCLIARPLSSMVSVWCWWAI